MCWQVATTHAATTAFVNINVVPMTSETVLRSQTVIVTDGRVTAIGAVDTSEVPEGATIVDGTDRYLMPGLAEMHGHVPGVNSANLSRVLSLYVANGITTVRGMLGQPSHLALRRDIEAGTTLGPRLITSGPSLNGNSVASPAAGREMVRRQHAEGYDFLKIHPGLTRDEFDAIAETANELGMPFAGHVPADVGLDHALQAGIATIDHLDGYMEALMPPNDDPSGGVGGFFGVFIAGQANRSRIGELAAATRDAGTWNVPTQSLFEHATSPDFDSGRLADRTEMQYMAAASVAQWRSSRDSILADGNYDPEVARRAVSIRHDLIKALHDSWRRLVARFRRAADFQCAGLRCSSRACSFWSMPGCRHTRRW